MYQTLFHNRFGLHTLCHRGRASKSKGTHPHISIVMEQDNVLVSKRTRIRWDDSTCKHIPKCHIVSLNTLSTSSIAQRKSWIVAIGFSPLQDKYFEKLNLSAS